ncbi:MAG: AbrB/MazE/SpoVT family DNA-binding domain-containing protein [archaeon YNP-WB-062]|jgi:AbrB family looped-hinge helix DNA binding protein|nr:AbrB/MazE/SpoVT family DNA-binding domain-containing protein [Candidatus Culexarchaeum yellowstonense]
MEYSRIDKQGRIVIPSRIRKLIGVEGEAEVLIRVEGGRIVIEPVSRNLEERVKEWVETALSMRAEPFSEEVEGAWKWMSEDYAKRKLGLLS